VVLYLGVGGGLTTLHLKNHLSILLASQGGFCTIEFIHKFSCILDKIFGTVVEN
jgi:hypothetical protein